MPRQRLPASGAATCRASANREPGSHRAYEVFKVQPLSCNKVEIVSYWYTICQHGWRNTSRGPGLLESCFNKPEPSKDRVCAKSLRGLVSATASSSVWRPASSAILHRASWSVWLTPSACRSQMSSLTPVTTLPNSYPAFAPIWRSATRSSAAPPSPNLNTTSIISWQRPATTESARSRR